MTLHLTGEMSVGDERHDDDDNLFITEDGVELSSSRVRSAYETWDGKLGIPVTVDLLVDEDGTLEGFRYWLYKDSELERAKGLVPVDPLTILAQICSRLTVAPSVFKGMSHDVLFCEMIENGSKLTEITGLIELGLESDTIVEQLSSEIIQQNIVK
jgi:hypothetical protein